MLTSQFERRRGHARPSRTKRVTQSAMKPITQYCRIRHTNCTPSSTPIPSFCRAVHRAARRISRLSSSCTPFETRSVHADALRPSMEPSTTFVRKNAFQKSSASVETASASEFCQRLRSPRWRTKHERSWCCSQTKSPHRTCTRGSLSPSSGPLVFAAPRCDSAYAPTA